tara:strand:+ start:837 stop:1229 length:393 start_codon:yes stop_codon:yes gene_type:complete
MLSNNNSHRIKVETRKVMRLKEKALEWEEWHGTWLESAMNNYFDYISVASIKSQVLACILEDEADKDEVVSLLFYEQFKDYLKSRAITDKQNMYKSPDTVPTPATIDTMFELDIPIVEEMYEAFCEHYGI